LWAKLQVVLAAISAGAVPLAAIAMVTAVIAAFFYLRVAVLMYAGPDSAPVEASGGSGEAIAWASPDGVSGTVTALNTQLVLADETPEEQQAVPVPPLTAVALGLCVAVTVVFGVIPGPVVDFANHATLLFLGH
jgi:NADH-quinone oxidoreductase subunit N